ncbi:MAG: hypothetical protein ACLPN6_25775 [Streptosporangiaceae bacterium]|jgi:hypothetical protein
MSEDEAMAEQQFQLTADVSTADPAAIGPLLRQLVAGSITETADGFHVEAAMTGPAARDLNRSLLSALRRAERRTRLRAEWTAGGMTERFFDYVPKGTRPALPRPLP